MDDAISRQAAISIPLTPKGLRKYHTCNLDDAYDEGWWDYQACVSQLPPAQPEQRWIPCSEKLPEKSGQYYVSGKGKVWICEFLTIHSSTILLGGWCNDAANPVVQAWMPLPEPYREDNR